MSHVVVDRDRADVALVRLNRPERLNALSYAMLGDLLAALDAIDDDPTCRVVVLTGEGRGFCAGIDLKEVAELGAEPGTDGGGPAQAGIATQKRRWNRIAPRLRSLRQPVIAAVNGPAVGVGMILAVASDIRVASTEARFVSGFAAVGVAGGEQGLNFLLPRLVGLGRAAELMLTGRPVPAEEAERIGLASTVTDPDRLLPTALEVADRIVASSPFGMWMTKDNLWASLEVGSLQAVMELENRTQILASLTADHREQLRAFREQRTADYHNR